MSFKRPVFSLAQIGQLLKQKRSGLGIDIETLGARLEIDARTLEKIEKGKKALTSNEFKTISSFVEKSFQELTSLHHDKDVVVLCRTSSSSEEACKTVEKAQTIFHELLGQAALKGL